jgi:hypothetical protein
MILEMLGFFINTIVFHQVGAFVIWAILELSTRNFRFRNSDSSDPVKPRYPIRISLLLSVALISPFLIPGYPTGDVANFGLLLSRMGCVVLGTALLSLYFGARFKSRSDLKDLFLAILGTITSAVALFFLLLMSTASPV